MPGALTTIKVAGGLAKMNEENYAQAATIFSSLNYSADLNVHGASIQKNISLRMLFIYVLILLT